MQHLTRTGPAFLEDGEIEYQIDYCNLKPMAWRARLSARYSIGPLAEGTASYLDSRLSRLCDTKGTLHYEQPASSGRGGKIGGYKVLIENRHYSPPDSYGSS